VKRLPSLKKNDLYEQKRDILSRWLIERDAELVFRQLDGEKPLTTAPTEELHIAQSFDQKIINNYAEEPPETGQIRLLAPEQFNEQSRPVYVAVIKEWEDNIWLTAPFSSYTVPALPGELLMQRPETPLQVLCVWNTRTIPSRAFQTSWIAGTMTAQELEDAWNLFRAVSTGSAIPENIAPRTGPHVLRENDPRIMYQQEELEMLDIWQNSSSQVADNIISMNWLVSDMNDHSMRLAADDTTSVFQPRQWTTDTEEITIDIQPDYESQMCLVMIFDDNGEISTRLDDYIIRIPETNVSVKISAGHAAIPMRQLLSGLALNDAAGNPVTVRIKQN
jgi:hypothetical protein